MIKQNTVVNCGNRGNCILPISWPIEDNTTPKALRSTRLGANIPLFDEEEY